MAKDVFDYIDAQDNEEGDSTLYVGVRFLKLISTKMEKIEKATEEAYTQKGDMCLLWLYQLRGFYDLIENRTGLCSSKSKIKLMKSEFDSNLKKYIKKEIEIEEKDKYELYFDEIENMIERNQKKMEVGNTGKLIKYNNDKKILKELSKCTRELFKDANKHHLILPEGVKNIKLLAKKEWIDRPRKKEF